MRNHIGYSLVPAVAVILLAIATARSIQLHYAPALSLPELTVQLTMPAAAATEPEAPPPGSGTPDICRGLGICRASAPEASPVNAATRMAAAAARDVMRHRPRP